jgi:molybdopterin-synthase adenylyltransferase
VRLTDEQIELYSRQIILREVGGTGQVALRASRVRVLGAGAAAEACTSYLVGAGIGALEVDAAGPRHDAARVLPLPEPGRRTPDAAVTANPREHEASGGTASPDVLIDLDLGASRAASSVVPRLGSILLRGDAHGGLHLVLLPGDAGCPACTHAAGAPRAADPPPPIASASAGALAALTCCRWILGIGHDAQARALVLPAGSGLWTDGAPPVRIACPRGCPPPAHPV